MAENKILTAPQKAFMASAIILFIYFLPFLLLGERSYFTIMDCLDSNYVWLHVLKISGEEFSFAPNVVVPNIMNGLPRCLFGTGIHFVNVIFYLFSPSTAYIINFIITHLLGFFGMYFLLKTHILKEESQRTAAIICSLIFGVVPFYSIYGACIPFQPFLLYAFLNLIQEKKTYWIDYLIIVLFPFYTYTVVVGAFALITLAIIIIIKSIVDKKIYKRYLFGIGLLFGVSLLLDLPLLYETLFNSGFVSTRSEINRAAMLTENYLWTIIDDTTDNLFKTQEHTGEFYTYPTLIAALAAISFLLFKKEYKNPLPYLVSSIVIIAVFSAAYIPICGAIGDKIKIIRDFQFDRFYFLLPAAWIIVLAFSVKELFNYKALRPFAWLLIIAQFIIVFCFNREFKANIKLLAHHSTKEPNCKSFYDTPLFSQVNNYIGKPQKDYRVVSVGLPPTIAQFNGFYTLDGYQPVYDLNYKHEFRDVILKEINKNYVLRTYFYCWGSRCYMFCSQLNQIKEGVFYGRDSAKQINYPAYNYSLLKQMGCRYIISSVKINNADPEVLSFEKEFEDNDSYWDIFLYKLK